MGEILHYSTPEQVIQYTGVRPEDFSLEADEDDTAEEKLDLVITSWLIQAKDMINQDRNRDYLEGVSVPPGIHHIALRIVSNMVAQAQLRRETPVVKHDDYSLQMVDDQVFTEAIRKDLAKFPFKPNLIMFVTRGGAVEEEEEEVDDDDG